MISALLALSLILIPAAPKSAIVAQPFNPNLQVFGGQGPFFNWGLNDQAMTNASAHAAWSVMVPLAGHYIGGQKGMRWAGLGWGVVTLLEEGFFHAPKHPDPYYPSEVRTDLFTKLVPGALIILADWLIHRE